MTTFKRFVLSLTFGVMLAAFAPLSAAFAASTPPVYQLKSAAYTSECLDVYGNSARVGTPVGLYKCNTSDPAQRFAFGANAKKYVQIYFKPNLTVGEVKVGNTEVAELVSNTSSSSYMTDSVVSPSHLTFNFLAGGALTDTGTGSPASFKTATFKPNTKASDQVWQFVQL